MLVKIGEGSAKCLSDFCRNTTNTPALPYDTRQQMKFLVDISAKIFMRKTGLLTASGH